MSQRSEPGGGAAPLDASLLASIARDLHHPSLEPAALAAVLARADLAILVCEGAAHVVRHGSPRFATRIGAPVRAGTTLDAVLPELPREARDAFDRVLATGAPVVCRELRRAGDPEAYYTLTLHPVRGAPDAVSGVLAIATESTESAIAAREVRSAALRRSEEQLRFIVDALPALVAYVDRDLVYRWCNDAYEHWFGAAAARRYVGRSMPDVVGARACEVLQPRIDAVLRGERVTFEDEVPYAEGGARWVDATYAPVRGADGEVEGFVALVQDVSDRRRAERALDLLARASVELGSSLDVDVVLADLTRVLVPEVGEWCGVYLRADDGRITLSALTHRVPEKAALLREEMMRRPRAPDAPRGYSSVIRSGRAEIYSRIEPWMLEASAIDAEHLELLRAIAPRSVMIVPLAAQGQVLGALSIGRSDSGVPYDAADLALAEELGRRAAGAIENARLFALAQRERVRAEDANRAKDEFLAMVSHELRTPLNAILGWAKLLEAGGLDEARRARAATVIARNAKAQAQLIDDLLDVTRVVSGKIRLEIEQIDLGRVIDAALESMRPAADAKQLTIDVVRDPAATTLLGDAARLQQVVYNLLSNAVKFTPPGGRVGVRSERDGGVLRIVVSDSGEGIDPAFLPHVFERFRQAEVGTTRSKGGLGLGLAIVRNLVELHGGTIVADSAGRGHGATFTVELPIAVDQIAPRRPITSPGMPGVRLDVQLEPSLRGVRVLVVDDEDDARDLLRAMLESRGATVATSASVAEALAGIARGFGPDVLVSDIGMPGEDGYTLIERVRRLPVREAQVPAVALTAFARSEDRARALDAGFDVHVAKPFDPVELLAIVERLAGRSA